MDRATRRAAKAPLVAEILQGSSWQEAERSAGLQMSRTTAYRLLHRVRPEGAAALDDQRTSTRAEVMQEREDHPRRHRLGRAVHPSVVAVRHSLREETDHADS